MDVPFPSGCSATCAAHSSCAEACHGSFVFILFWSFFWVFLLDSVDYVGFLGFFSSLERHSGFVDEKMSPSNREEAKCQTLLQEYHHPALRRCEVVRQASQLSSLAETPAARGAWRRCTLRVRRPAATKGVGLLPKECFALLQSVSYWFLA